MSKRILTLMAVLAAGMASSLPAGEELMPLHPGAYTEVGSGASVGSTRRVTSESGRPEPPRQPLRRNMVTLKLPSLGAKGESRLRLVEARDAADGSLEFDMEKSTAIPDYSRSEIPGLVAPELLALDQYTLLEPEPERPHPAEPVKFPEPPKAVARAVTKPAAAIEPVVATEPAAMAGPAVEESGEALRKEIVPRSDAAFPRKAPAASAKRAAKPKPPARPPRTEVNLPPPLLRTSPALSISQSPTSLTPSSLTPPPASGANTLRPPETAAPSPFGDLRPPESSPSAPMAPVLAPPPRSLEVSAGPPAPALVEPEPDVWYGDLPAAGPAPRVRDPFQPPKKPLRDEWGPLPEPYDDTGLTPMRELRNVLSPIYRGGKK